MQHLAAADPALGLNSGRVGDSLWHHTLIWGCIQLCNLVEPKMAWLAITGGPSALGSFLHWDHHGLGKVRYLVSR